MKTADNKFWESILMFINNQERGKKLMRLVKTDRVEKDNVLDKLKIN